MHRRLLKAHEANDSLRCARLTTPTLKSISDISVVAASVEDVAVGIEES
jgi:hypothetical protein